jgi:myo-inositol-1(or 4)-monophosphatase
MRELLQLIFRQVRSYMRSGAFNRESVYSLSEGHTTMLFDREAEDIIISALIESEYSFEVITEERPVFTTRACPTYRIVIDPVDGSTNVVRGIMSAALALAVLPIDVPITPERVQWALVGELYSGAVYEAGRGEGAFCNGRKCQVSTTSSYSESLVGINSDGRSRDALRALLIDGRPPAYVRRSGSSALDLAYVANGAYDAYVDIGDVLTGESFLASASIVLEAGGIVTGEQGKPLRPIKSLQDRYSIIAAGNKTLHSAILERVRGAAQAN